MTTGPATVDAAVDVRGGRRVDVLDERRVAQRPADTSSEDRHARAVRVARPGDLGGAGGHRKRAVGELRSDCTARKIRVVDVDVEAGRVVLNLLDQGRARRGRPRRRVVRETRRECDDERTRDTRVTAMDV
jgi:hypothetical protein